MMKNILFLLLLLPTIAVAGYFDDKPILANAVKESVEKLPAETRYFFVNPITGSDTTGGTNNPARPWKNLDLLAPNVAAGDVVVLSAGTHYMTNEFPIPANGAVIGAGTNLTILKFYGSLTAGVPIAFWLSDNCYLGRMFIDCALRGAGTNSTYPNWQQRFQASYGEPSRSPGATNALIELVTSTAETDIYFNRAYPSEHIISSCGLTSKWDTVLIATTNVSATNWQRLFILDSHLDAGATTNWIAPNKNENNAISCGNTNAFIMVVNSVLLNSNGVAAPFNQNDNYGTNFVMYGGAITNRNSSGVNAFCNKAEQRQDFYGVTWDSSDVDDDFGTGNLIINTTNVTPSGLGDFFRARNIGRKKAYSAK